MSWCASETLSTTAVEGVAVTITVIINAELDGFAIIGGIANLRAGIRVSLGLRIGPVSGSGSSFGGIGRSAACEPCFASCICVQGPQESP